MKLTPNLKSFALGTASQSFSHFSISGISPDSSSSWEVSTMGEFMQNIFLHFHSADTLMESIDLNSESGKQFSKNSFTLIDKLSQMLRLNKELGILACSWFLIIDFVPCVKMSLRLVLVPSVILNSHWKGFPLGKYTWKTTYGITTAREALSDLGSWRTPLLWVSRLST